MPKWTYIENQLTYYFEIPQIFSFWLLHSTEDQKIQDRSVILIEFVIFKKLLWIIVNYNYKETGNVFIVWIYYFISLMTDD